MGAVIKGLQSGMELLGGQRGLENPTANAFLQAGRGALGGLVNQRVTPVGPAMPIARRLQDQGVIPEEFETEDVPLGTTLIPPQQRMRMGARFGPRSF